ncbi:MAG TPA: hypothetical protein VHO26_06935, partial [Propionibacteriaceae bacterium]|nr:hypothetical protein [Propionibacteriaceae bacterium]
GGARPDVFTHYDPATGLVDYTGPLDRGTGQLADADKTTVVDAWGRPVLYRSEAGDVTTTIYDSAGRVASVVDPKGTTTTTWDGTDAAGNAERRGLPTRVSVTRAGADGGSGTLDFTGAYDANGVLVEQHLPGGMIQRTDYDIAGQPVGLSYEGQVTPKTPRVDGNGDPVLDADGNPVYDAGTPTTGTWLAWTQASDAAGRVRVDYTGAGSSFDPTSAGVTSLDQVVAPTGAAVAYDRAYSYDQAGRLVSVADRTATATGSTLDPGTDPSAGAPCQVRAYTFDRNGRRTGLTGTDHSDGDCAGSTGVSVSTDLVYAYDSADRPTTAATGTRNGSPAAAGTYSYDGFGRQLLVPATDAPNPAAGDITLGYYDDDLAHTITQGATTTELALDSGGRRTLATTTDTSATPSSTSTLERHYSDAGDSPAWTVATATAGTSTITRYSESLGGDLAATIASDGAAQLTLANLHGDVVTTIDIPTTQATSDPATTITGWADYTEYGTPRDGAATAAVAGTVGYGWLGAKQRSTTAETAGLTLMGDRLYNPAVGAFTSTDPEPGGSSWAYGYPNDPVNAFDLNGRSWWRKVLKYTAIGAGVIGALACGASIICGVAVGAAAGFGAYAAMHAGRHQGWSWRGAGVATGVGALSGLSWGVGARAAGWRFASRWKYGVRFSHRGGRGTDFLVRGQRRFAIHSHRIKSQSRLKFIHYHRRYNGPGGAIGRHRPWESW